MRQSQHLTQTPPRVISNEPGTSEHSLVRPCAGMRYEHPPLPSPLPPCVCDVKSSFPFLHKISNHVHLRIRARFQMQPTKG